MSETPHSTTGSDNKSSNQQQGGAVPSENTRVVVDVEQAEIDSANTQTNSAKKHHDGYDIARLVISSLTFIAATAAAIFAGWLALLTKDLAHDSAVNLEASTRAYIAVTGARFDSTPKAGLNQRIKILYKNVGREPAADVSHFWGWSGNAFEFKLDGLEMPYISLETTKWPRISECNFDPQAVPNRRPVYADVTNEAMVYVFNDRGMPASVINGTASFYIVGCFVYRSLGKTRTSPYCLYYQPARGKSVEDGTFEWCPSGGGNAT